MRFGGLGHGVKRWAAAEGGRDCFVDPAHRDRLGPGGGSLERVDFGFGEEDFEVMFDAFGRRGEHALDSGRMLRVPGGGVGEERVDGGQSAHQFKTSVGEQTQVAAAPSSR